MKYQVKSYKRTDTDRLKGHYVIMYYRNGMPRYMADPNKEDRIWTNRLENAKCYIDLSAAEIKAGNLKYGMHPINAMIKYITYDGKLVNARRNRYAR